MPREVVRLLDLAEQVHAHDREDEEEEHQDASDVDERRQREQQRLQQRSQSPRATHQPEHPRHPEHAQHRDEPRARVRGHRYDETDEGKPHDGEVEPVPWVLEVVHHSQRRDLGDDLAQKHKSEERVGDEQIHRPLLRFTRVGETHHEDVGHDADHDEHVEQRVRHDAKDLRARRLLWRLIDPRWFTL